MDKIRFDKACDTAFDAIRGMGGIGTLGERTMHLVLKHYLCEDTDKHEIKVSGFVADILDGNEIIEIQTGSFGKLRKKLEIFLESYAVTVVYPIAATKRIILMERESAELLSERRSPRRGNIYDIAPELYRIKQFLKHPNLKLQIMFMDVEEYRQTEIKSRRNRKGYSRADSVPKGLLSEVVLACEEDYNSFIPECLDEPFTVKEYRAAAKTYQRYAGIILNVLEFVGAVKRCGKRGNAYLYVRRS